MENVTADYSASSRAAWILIYLVCGLSLIPFSIFVVPVAGLLLVASFILSIVVLTRGGTGEGILLLFMSVVIGPVIVFLGPIMVIALWNF